MANYSIDATLDIQRVEENTRFMPAVGMTVALIATYSGQAVLLRAMTAEGNEARMQIIGGGLSIAAALLFGLAAPRAAPLAARLDFPAEPDSAPTRWSWWAIAWVVAAVGLSVAAVVMFADSGEQPLVLASWLLGILALLVAQLPGLWRRPLYKGPSERPYALGLAALLAVALIMRTYQLTILPFYVDGDFAAVGLQARALALGETQRIFDYGWSAVPMLGYLPPWLTMQLFGTGLMGLNASGVVEGMLSIVGVYLLGRDLFRPRVGLLAAALLAFSYAHLAASRQSSYIDPVFFIVYTIWLLLIGLREGRGWALVASGLLAGLCVQMYYSGRLVVVLVGITVLFLLLRPRWVKARWWALLLWTLAFLAMLGPMLVVFVRDADGFALRTRDVFILKPENIIHQSGVYGTNTLPQLFAQQARRAALLFHYYPDTSTQFGFPKPLLDPFSAPLLSLGLGYALFHWRRMAGALLFAWMLLGVVLGCFLTINPPFWPRLLVLLPPAALLAAAALDLLYTAIKEGLGRPGDWLAPIAIALLLAWVGLINWNAYVAAPNIYPITRTLIGRYLAAQPPSTRALMVSNDYRHDDREFDFLAPGRLIGDLTPEQATGPIDRPGTPTLLILTSEQAGLVEQLRPQVPEGAVETHMGQYPGEIAFYVVRLQ